MKLIFFPILMALFLGMEPKSGGTEENVTDEFARILQDCPEAPLLCGKNVFGSWNCGRIEKTDKYHWKLENYWTIRYPNGTEWKLNFDRLQAMCENRHYPRSFLYVFPNYRFSCECFYPTQQRGEQLSLEFEPPLNKKDDDHKTALDEKCEDHKTAVGKKEEEIFEPRTALENIIGVDLAVGEGSIARFTRNWKPASFIVAGEVIKKATNEKGEVMRLVGGASQLVGEAIQTTTASTYPMAIQDAIVGFGLVVVILYSIQIISSVYHKKLAFERSVDELWNDFDNFLSRPEVSNILKSCGGDKNKATDIMVFERSVYEVWNVFGNFYSRPVVSNTLKSCGGDKDKAVNIMVPRYLEYFKLMAK